MRNSKSSLLALCVNDSERPTYRSHAIFLLYQFPVSISRRRRPIPARHHKKKMWRASLLRISIRIKKLRRSISLLHTREGGGRFSGATREIQMRAPANASIHSQRERRRVTMKKCSWPTHIKQTHCISDRKTEETLLGAHTLQHGQCECACVRYLRLGRWDDLSNW